MKRGIRIPIFHQDLKSRLLLSPRNSLSTLVSKDSDQFSDVYQGADLLRKASNGNLLVLDLIDRRVMEPDATLYLELVKKCTDRRSLEEGQLVHSHFLASRFCHYRFVQIAIMNMYAKCGEMELARKLFDGMTERNSVAYSALISGYSQGNEFKEALGLYIDMLKMGLWPNRCTLMSALKSAAGIENGAMGSGIHGACVKYRCEKNVYVGSALLDMYARCNRITEANAVFEGLESKNVVSWNALIAAYSRKGDEHSAVKLLMEMKRGSFEPTRSTYASVLAACASSGALEQGKMVHSVIIKSALELSVFVGDALLDMYGKAGSIEDAERIFYRLVKKDVVSWSSMLAAYAYHGLGREAVNLFEEMRGAGFKPDEVSFVCVLKACSHGGLLDEGLYYFELMRKYNLEPNIKHYVLIVDLLGRVGQLDRAERFVRALPVEPTGTVWRALLGACGTHKNLELGAYAAERVLELEPYDSGSCVILSNIYASAGRLGDAARVRNTMLESGLRKEHACSWVEIGDGVRV